MGDDVGGTGLGLALLRRCQWVSFHFCHREQPHLLLHRHLPGTCHLTHKLQTKNADCDWNIISFFQNINVSTNILGTFFFFLLKMTDGRTLCITGTSTPVLAARSHSQQAIAVSMPFSVNIFSGDQHRWCRSCGSQSTVQEHSICNSSVYSTTCPQFQTDNQSNNYS